jgi:hypothetical protein
MKDEQTVTLKAPHWNVVMVALMKAPLSYEIVAPVIQTLADKLELPQQLQPNGSAGMETADVPH